MIDHADERAAFFFISGISSVGTNGYDGRVASPQNPPDHFEVADIRTINTTMMARTSYEHHPSFAGGTGRSNAAGQGFHPPACLIRL